MPTVSREQQKLLAGGVGAILLIGVYTAYWLGPLQREAGELTQQVRGAHDQLRVLEMAIANEPALMEQRRRLDRAVTAWFETLPSEKELPMVIERLSTLASQSHVKIETIVPQRPPVAKDTALRASGTRPEPLGYQEMSLQIDALAGYHQIGAFLGLVESSDNPMRVSTLHLSPDPRDPRRLHVQVGLQAYLGVSGQPATSGKPTPST